MPIFSHVEPDKSTFAANATQFWSLIAADKPVRLLYMAVEAVATAAALKDIYLLKGRAATAGGTTSDRSSNIINHQSGDGVSGVKIYTYTANPTTVATGANIRASRMVCPAAATGATGSKIEWDWSDYPATAPIIPPSTSGGGSAAGNSGFHLFSDAGAVPAGLSMYITVTFEEVA